MCHLMRTMLPSKRFLCLGVLACFVGVANAGCTAEPSTNPSELGPAEDDLTQVTASEKAAAARTSLSGFTYERLTPTTTRIMKAARYWMTVQDDFPRYPKPRMCATNVSKVLFLAGINSVDEEGVRAFLADVNSDGGRVHKMGRDPETFAEQLNTLFRGAPPAGTIIAGLNVSTSAPGDQHIGVVGHTDPDGTVWIYHNNWYRPANENGQRKPHMVSEENLRRGFERQWMATPWIRIKKDASGRVTDVAQLLPALDDMAPFHPQFRNTLALLPGVADELGL
jgi:hypothetical protein